MIMKTIKFEGKIINITCQDGIFSWQDQDGTSRDSGTNFDDLGSCLKDAFKHNEILVMSSWDNRDKKVVQELIRTGNTAGSPLVVVGDYLILGEPFPICREPDPEPDPESDDDYGDDLILLDRSSINRDDFDIADAMRIENSNLYNAGSHLSNNNGYAVRLSDCGTAAWLFFI